LRTEMVWERDGFKHTLNKKQRRRRTVYMPVETARFGKKSRENQCGDRVEG